MVISQFCDFFLEVGGWYNLSINFNDLGYKLLNLGKSGLKLVEVGWGRSKLIEVGWSGLRLVFFSAGLKLVKVG